MDGRWSAGLIAAVVMGAAAAGCDDGGSEGSLVIVNNQGGAAAASSSTGTSGPPPGGFTVVDTDPAGGVILESSDHTTRRISGSFHESLTLEAQYDWYLDAPVFVGVDDASLTPVMTIQAGTTVLGRGGTPPAMLVIRRGARLEAAGTAAAPIVFTSAQPAGQRAPGDWGGIVINGRAPVNAPSPLGEGATGPYGGADPGDDSGTLRYVRVEYAGHVFTSDDELNGIALQGVGNGTEIDFVQLHRAADDGIEFFGGTVDVKHVLVTGALDDSLDWTFGWTGRAQFVVLQQWDGGADNGIEADNNSSNNGLTPRSRPTITNLTIVGAPTAGQQSTNGLLLRQGTAANVSNAIVMEMNTSGLDVDQTSTFDVAYADEPAYSSLSGELTVSNTWFFANATDFTGPEPGEPAGADVAEISALQTNANTTGTDPQLEAPTSPSAPDFRPRAGSPVLTGWISPNSDPFFQTVPFVGAMDRTDWSAGWTTHVAN